MNIREFIVFEVGKIIPDRWWVQIKFKQWFGHFADLKNPKTYNEKLTWLKLYDHNPDYIKMVDKYEMKKLVEHKVGEEYVIPVIGGPWNSFEEIEFSKLPDQFVLKTTHDCGGVVVCTDKRKFDINAARKKLTEHLKRNYYLTGREWPYKYVKPRIFAEAYMKDEKKRSGTVEQLTDYKFFCFDGVVKAMFIATDRADKSTDTKFDFFDENYNHLDFVQGHPNAEICPEKPIHFELMKEIASKISKGYPELRVDFYEVGDRIYIGELTLYHFSGNVPFKPEKWDYEFGKWVDLDKCIRK